MPATPAMQPVHFPMPFCLSFVDDSGKSCTACYDEWGVEMSRQCKAPKVTCAVQDVASGTRCLFCDDNPSLARACLKCDGSVDAASCSACEWSDTGAACKRCADASGAITIDDCDALRPELR